MSSVLELQAQDRVSWVAPFGVQFCDAVTRAPIRMGLEVVIRLQSDPQQQMRAHANSSGILLAHRLPGMAARMAGMGDAEFWRNPPPVRDYQIQVSDRMGRYLPLRFQAALPLRGLCVPDVLRGSPPMSSEIPLYSTPSRPRPGPMALIRSQLRDVADDSAVPWALVEAWHSGRMLGRGVSDASGHLLLMFAYPEPERRAGSPPAGVQASPAAAAPLFSWDLELRVYSSGDLPADLPPDCDGLLKQKLALALQTISPPQPLPGLTLQFGRETTLATAGSSFLYLQRT